MAELDKESIKVLTKLCRIECTDDEQESLLKDLKSILTYVELLQEVDTTHTPPCNHVIQGMNNVMREDEVGKTLPREVFLANAPSHVGGLIKVPPVFKSS